MDRPTPAPGDLELHSHSATSRRIGTLPSPPADLRASDVYSRVVARSNEAPPVERDGACREYREAC
jgi:hypothetical protein